ncbi:MAG: hypothetical protein Q8P50_05715 [Bacillota bacterium]|jgi:hypothetical protein|nr:hypothetical protein [Bacillota bacterium]
MSFFLGVVLLGFSALSVRRRVRNRVKVYEERTGEDVPQTPSPASRAIMELGGLAGGIYIAITALMSFLQLSLPDKVSVLGVQIGPIALLALLIAIIQPYFARRR